MFIRFSILGLCLLLTTAFSLEANAELMDSTKQVSSVDKDGRRHHPGRRVGRRGPGRRVGRGIPGRRVGRGIPGRRVGRRIPGRRAGRGYGRRFPRPYPRVFTCQVGLRTYRNYISARFLGHARGIAGNAVARACNQAMNKCLRYQRSTYSRGRCVRL